LENNNFRHLSSGGPTYWPSDRKKLPDLVDYCVTKGIPCNFADAKPYLELSPDHSPVFVTLSTQTILRVPDPDSATGRQIGMLSATLSTRDYY
jgi:hypothetical protein